MMRFYVHLVSGKTITFETDKRLVKALVTDRDLRFLSIPNRIINLDNVEYIDYEEQKAPSEALS